MRRNKRVQDLTEAMCSAPVGEGAIQPDDRLSVLEDEHRLLSERRRRLHQSIDMLEGLRIVKPDAAARLERYKLTETEVSRRRRGLYLEISALRSEQREHEYSAH